MRNEGEIWGLILAAGDGKRLAAVTTDASGRSVPKQYCNLIGGTTLLARTIERLRALVPRRRMLAVVAEAHRAIWAADQTHELPPENVVVQPENRGTAAGLLLPLLEIARRDPAARVIVTPADHFVADERALMGALLEALSALERPLDRVMLLGISPDAPVGDYGWIVPAPGGRGTLHRVARFIEKPGAEEALALAAAGGVWNSFLMVARASKLLALYERHHPALLASLRAALAAAPEARPAVVPETVARAYQGLSVADFSRDILEGSVADLALIVAPECGWTDLGTPERLASCLRVAA